jgi:branched-chain amino acid transport system ATP-binding protein
LRINPLGRAGNVLEVQNIDTYYDDSRVLDHVSLNVAPGEMVAILGRNGVGKSTTLKSIMGLVKPRSGSIWFKNEQIRGRSPFDIARRGIGYVPEERRIFPGLTVRENLVMGHKTGRYRKQGGKWTIERVYDQFPQLAERDGTAGGKLSGGEQQMLTIVRTLMGDPELVLMDEPSEGLSPTMAKNIFGIIEEIHREGLAVILVDRNLAYTCTMAQRVYVMSKGSIGFTGTGQEVLQSREIQAKFLAV